MIRPFTIRDLALVRRLAEQGMSLHAESALADSVNPLRGALLGMFVGGNQPTFVWKSTESDEAGFLQLRLEEARHHAHIVCISPMLKQAASDADSVVPGINNIINGHVWLPLLDQAVMEAGRQGIQSLVAEVDETGLELPVLRRAGFAVYTRQDIWVREQLPEVTDTPVNLALTPRRAGDDWDIQLLYANTVPRLVQLAEPIPPLDGGEAWVLRDGDELAAYVHIHMGSVATWLRFFIHPNAESEADNIVTAALQVQSSKINLPIFCCVRRYESWLPSALERNGFRIYSSQAVMVKHTVHHLKKPMPELTAVLEKQGMTASTPIVQRYRPHRGAN